MDEYSCTVRTACTRGPAPRLRGPCVSVGRRRCTMAASGATVSAQEVATFRSAGTLLKPSFFTPDEAAAMRQSVEVLRRRKLLANLQVDGTTQNLHMHWPSHHHLMWQVLPWERRVRSAVDRLLGAEAGVEVQYDQIFYKPAVTGEGTPFHTDNAYFRIQDPLRGVAMWIALQDSTAANGTLHVAPWAPGQPARGHQHDTKQHGHELEISGETRGLLDSATVCNLPAGGVAFFCYGVPHCTLPNTTADPRCAVAYHFVDVAQVANHERFWARRHVTGARSNGGVREYGGWGGDATADELWRREVAQATCGPLSASLPHIDVAEAAIVEAQKAAEEGKHAAQQRALL